MRDATAVRRRLLEQLRLMLRRSGMFATTGREAELLGGGILGDLCFLDERDHEYDEARAGLRARYGKLGVTGAFEAVFGDETNYGPEVLSVYAQALARLGYVTPDRRVTGADWDTLLAGMRDRFGRGDLRLSEIVELAGAPGLIVDRRVLCYAGADDDHWVVADCWEPGTTRYASDRGTALWRRTEDPLVRDIRVPAPTFAESLVLTRYGKYLRWGPGGRDAPTDRTVSPIPFTDRP